MGEIQPKAMANLSMPELTSYQGWSSTTPSRVILMKPWLRSISTLQLVILLTPQAYFTLSFRF